MLIKEIITETVSPDIVDNPSSLWSHSIDQDGFKLTATKTYGQNAFSSRGFDVGQDVPGLRITVTDKQTNMIIASTDFFINRNRQGDMWLESEYTRVDNKYQNQGLATMMYAYAKMLGNDVRPSKHQSIKGKNMWRKWYQQGDVHHLTGKDKIRKDLTKLPKVTK